MKNILTFTCTAITLLILISLSIFLYKSENNISLRSQNEIAQINVAATTEKDIIHAFIKFSQMIPKKTYDLATRDIEADNGDSINILLKHNEYLVSLSHQRWNNMILVFIAFFVIIVNSIIILCINSLNHTKSSKIRSKAKHRTIRKEK